MFKLTMMDGPSGSGRTATRWRVVACLVAMLMVVAACGDAAPSDSTSDEAGEEGDEGEATAASSDALEWWGWSPTPQNAERYIAAFNEEYPDIEINYRYFETDPYIAALRPALAGGEGPDLFNISGGRAVSSVSALGGNAIDLEPAIEEALGADWASQVSQSGIDAFTRDDGELVGLSLGFVAAGNLWINHEMFEEHGLEPPTDLDEWIEVCDEFRANDVGCLTIGAGQGVFNLDTVHAIVDTIHPGFWNEAARGEIEWTDPAFVEALEIWLALQEEGIMDPGSVGLTQYPDANNVFQSQQSPMVQMGTWYRQYTTMDGAISGQQEAGVGDPEPFTMLPIPFPDVGGRGAPAPLFVDADYGIAVNSASDRQDDATTFAVWLATSEVGQGTIADALDLNPALAAAEPDWDEIEFVDPELQRPALEELSAQAAEATESRNFLIGTEITQAIEDATIAVLDGVAPEEAAASVQAAMD